MLGRDAQQGSCYWGVPVSNLSQLPVPVASMSEWSVFLSLLRCPFWGDLVFAHISQGKVIVQQRWPQERGWVWPAFDTMMTKTSLFAEACVEPGRAPHNHLVLGYPKQRKHYKTPERVNVSSGLTMQGLWYFRDSQNVSISSMTRKR